MNYGKIKYFFKQHGADILSITAGIGVVATGITAYKAGRAEDDTDKHNKLAAASLACGAATIGSIAGARYLGAKRESELAAAAMLLGSNYALYRDSVQSTVGEERNKEIDEKYIKNLNSLIEVTGQGDTVFIEEWTGRRFLSSLEVVQKAIIQFETDFSVIGYGSTNNFYSYLGIAPTMDGEIIGWTDKDLTGFEFDENDNVLFDEALTKVGIYLEEYPSLGYVIRYPVLPIVNFLDSCISRS